MWAERSAPSAIPPKPQPSLQHRWHTPRRRSVSAPSCASIPTSIFDSVLSIRQRLPGKSVHLFGQRRETHALHTDPLTFGQGRAGQTYVLKWEESYYQSYVSFFSDTQTLDITLGFPRTTPPTLDAALGLPLSAEEAPNCFGCHTTAGVNRGRVVADRLTPGVSCEACHGPGGRHSAAMKSSRGEKAYIFSPAKLKPDDLADLCGACHRTSVQVQVMGIRDVANVRFQPTGWKKAAAGIQTMRASVVWRVITPTSSSTKTRLSTTRSAWLA